MRDRRTNNLWYRRLDAAIRELGGMHNAHLHLDRVYTLDEKYMQAVGHRILDSSHVSLHRKHSLITDIHSGEAYTEKDFHHRVNTALDEMVDCNTRRADTLVDCTADGLGMQAMRWMQGIRKAREHEIDLRLAAYTPFGFDDSDPARWNLMLEAVKDADFVAALPEADETEQYPNKIGYMEHCRRLLRLAQDNGKSLHVHTDQRNEPSESGTERLVQVVREFGRLEGEEGEPMVWAIHVISPSTYDDARFERLVKEMVELNIGVISCPSAALGMRQYRPISTPTYNSIPRLLEMLAAGIHVRLGSDNIADSMSPSTTSDLVDEVFTLSAALRFYHPQILARLACGHPLTDDQREFVKEHLARNDAEIRKFLER